MTTKIHTFKVRGKGSFPLDMLRYDACHPVRPEDVDSLTEILGDEPRTVTLNSNHPPTVKRWASFGWKVVQLI